MRGSIDFSLFLTISSYFAQEVPLLRPLNRAKRLFLFDVFFFPLPRSTSLFLDFVEQQRLPLVLGVLALAFELEHLAACDNWIASWTGCVTSTICQFSCQHLQVSEMVAILTLRPRVPPLFVACFVSFLCLQRPSSGIYPGFER